MLIPISILVRKSASEPATEKTIAINPDSIANVEDSEEEGIIYWWKDGGDKPYKTRGTVEEFAGYINSFCLAEDETCQPVDSDTK